MYAGGTQFEDIEMWTGLKSLGVHGYGTCNKSVHAVSTGDRDMTIKDHPVFFLLAVRIGRRRCCRLVVSWDMPTVVNCRQSPGQEETSLEFFVPFDMMRTALAHCVRAKAVVRQQDETATKSRIMSSSEASVPPSFFLSSPLNSREKQG